MFSVTDSRTIATIEFKDEQWMPCDFIMQMAFERGGGL
jgi:hypothetical protein